MECEVGKAGASPQVYTDARPRCGVVGIHLFPSSYGTVLSTLLCHMLACSALLCLRILQVYIATSPLASATTLVQLYWPGRWLGSSVEEIL